MRAFCCAWLAVLGTRAVNRALEEQGVSSEYVTIDCVPVLSS